MPSPSLNRRQSNFIKEFLIDRNGTQAALRAGYPVVGAAVTANRLLKLPKIQAEIAKHVDKYAMKLDISVERILQEYARIGFLNPQSFYDKDGRLLSIPEMPEDAARAIAGIEEEDLYRRNEEGDREHVGVLKKIRITGKVSALEGLARYHGMFQDSSVGNSGFMIQINLNSPTRNVTDEG